MSVTDIETSTPAVQPLPPSAVIAVVGTGAMGAGIAQVAAAAGHVVKLLDNRPGAAAKAIEGIRGGIVRGPYDDAHERRAVVYDDKGNGLVFYSPLKR